MRLTIQCPGRTEILTAVGLVACLLLTAAVYWPGLDGGFMLDDSANIGEAYLANPTWDAVKYMVTHNGSGILGRGVSILSFVLTGMQYGLDPWGFKYHNLLLHLLTGVILFRLLQRLLPRLDLHLSPERSLLVAGATAALWLLHPLQLSTVLYAVQRMTQLSVLFTVLALLAYVNARLASKGGLRFYFLGWVLFPLCTLLAALSKEIGALIPVYALCLELFVLRPTRDQLRGDRRQVIFIGVATVLPLVLGGIALAIVFDSVTDYSARTFSLGERLLTQVHVVLFYVRLIFLPRIKDMSLFHDDYPVVTSFDVVTLLMIAVLVLVLAAIWYCRTRWPVVAFGLAWFLVGHLMESTIFPLELVFEHRNYLAVAGLLLLPVYAVVRFEPARKLLYVLPVVGLMFAFMTATRAREWGDSDLFIAMAVADHPRSGRALTEYVNLLAMQGNYEEVVEQLHRLEQLMPTEAAVNIHLQVIECSVDTKDEAALARARELIATYPLSVYAHNTLQALVVLLADQDCDALEVGDVETLVNEAIAFLGDEPAGDSYGHLLRLRGLLAFGKGYYADGVINFRLAHEQLGTISTLTELIRNQLALGQVGDAEDTLAVIEEQNVTRFGIEDYQVDEARQMLQQTKNAIAEAGTQMNSQDQTEGELGEVDSGTTVSGAPPP